MSTTVSPESVSLISLLKAPEKIGGLALRPITTGTYSLCLQAGSRLVAGAHGEAQPGKTMNMPYEVLLFIYIHTAPLEEVCDVVFDIPALRRKVFALGETLAISEIDAISARIMAMLDQATANIISPEKKQSPSEAAKEAHGPKA
jgi:hypothetical protein